MIHQITLAKIKSDDPKQTVETLMVEARIKLLRIPEVLNLKCGKAIVDTGNPHDFFVSLDFDNLSKQQIAHQNSLYVQYVETILRPVAVKMTTLEFEMEPGKDTRYS